MSAFNYVDVLRMWKDVLKDATQIGEEDYRA